MDVDHSASLRISVTPQAGQSSTRHEESVARRSARQYHPYICWDPTTGKRENIETSWLPPSTQHRLPVVTHSSIITPITSYTFVNTFSGDLMTAEPTTPVIIKTEPQPDHTLSKDPVTQGPQSHHRGEQAKFQDELNVELKYTIPWTDLPIARDKHNKRDENHKGQQCPGCICYREYISNALDYWDELPKWTSATKQDAEQVLKHLVWILRLEAVDHETSIENNVKTLTSTLSNPGQFSGLVGRMLCATGSLSFEKVSLSSSITKNHVKRLGIVKKEIYGVDVITSCINDATFMSLHSCSLVDPTTANDFRKKLNNGISVGFGTEPEASGYVHDHFEALFQSHEMAGLLIHQQRLDSTTEITNNDPNTTTFVGGKMDFLVVSLKDIIGNKFTDRIQIGDQAAGASTKGLFRQFKRWSRTYSSLDNQMSRALRNITETVSYETTLVEVKRSHQGFDDSQPVEQDWDEDVPTSLRNLLTQAGTINQILSTCRGLGSYGDDKAKVSKWISTDARSWRFGILDNDTGITSYTDLFDNTSRNLTEQILNILILWTTLPGKFLRDELFSHCQPYDVQESQ